MESGTLPPGPDRSNAADRWRGWLLAVEQKARADDADRQLEAMRASASWRLTAPLRSLMSWLRGKPETPPSLLPSQPPKQAASGLLAALDSLAHRGLLPAWTQSARPASGRRRLLLDVTVLASEDLGAGVQRVTRRLVGELMVQGRPEFDIELVRLTDRGTYALARKFAAAVANVADGMLGDDVDVTPEPGDIVLGLDFCRAYHVQLDAALERFRAAGATVVLLVHDVLPLQHPEWFPERVSQDFDAWLRVLARRSDAVMCISNESLRGLHKELQERGLPLPRLGHQVIGLGGDGLMPGAPSLTPRVVGTPAHVLMVGTIEPRKGHDQVLDAFERLWRQGVPVALTIAGKAGWMTRPLVERIRNHPMLGTQLHWLVAPDDLVLFDAYSRADLVLMASKGEGFGLPIAEGAWAGCDLLVRDIAVFREAAGESATYFEGTDGSSLAAAIETWLDRARTRTRGDARATVTTWSDCAAMIKRLCVRLDMHRHGDDNAVNAKGNQQ